MHSRAGKIADDRLIILRKTENDNPAACLILAEKATCFAADDHNGNLVLVCLHMDSCAITGVAFYVDSTAAHGIPCGISDIAFNDDVTVIHCISDCILCIAFHANCRTVEVSTKRISGRTRDCDGFIRHSRGDKSLTEAVQNFKFTFGTAEIFVEGGIVKPFCINTYHYTTPPSIFLR